jgi:hypothetical protein
MQKKSMDFRLGIFQAIHWWKPRKSLSQRSCHRGRVNLQGLEMAREFKVLCVISCSVKPGFWFTSLWNLHWLVAFESQMISNWGCTIDPEKQQGSMNPGLTWRDFNSAGDAGWWFLLDWTCYDVFGVGRNHQPVHQRWSNGSMCKCKSSFTASSQSADMRFGKSWPLLGHVWYDMCLIKLCWIHVSVLDG